MRDNLESQRRQYGLAERARALGWEQIEVIDDDLGRSGSGSHRPGFERLLAALCEGKVGAVFCIEASRLARNGRDWHTLLEFCRLVETLIVDEDGIYDPRQPNDRLLLGLKGTLSEMELSTLLQRSREALIQKARRGELFTTVAIGYVRAPNNRIEIDPDRRIRDAIGLVFLKFREFGSARQVLVWMRQEHIELPTAVYVETGRSVAWRLPIYNMIHHILSNPVYGGAYVYGRTKTTTRIENGRKRSFAGNHVAQKDWQVLISDHHEGYIDWDEYQANQRQITHNAAMKGSMVRGPARSGGALLPGLLRCGHCGRKLHVTYGGAAGQCLRYACQGALINHGTDRCISFGGLKAERLFEEELLHRLEPLGLQAALIAIDRQMKSGDEQLKQKELSLEQARFEVARARRQYDACDPDNRLVAAELERRWNETLKTYSILEQELQALRSNRPAPLSDSARRTLLQLGEDLPALWNHPRSAPQLKKRIARTLVHEIVVKKEGERISMFLHWQGGDHTKLEFMKNKPGKHRHASSDDVISLVLELARVQPDRGIVAILNRLGQRTGLGHTWTEARVCAFRHNHKISVYKEGERLMRGELTLEETAKMLEIGKHSVRHMLESKVLPARQACPGAPWIIQRDVVERMAATIKHRSPRPENADQISLKLQ